MANEIAQRLSPFEEAIQRLDSIPGVGRRSAEDVLAEIGVDMTRFPSAAHLASWARVCPGNNESAGKRKSGHAGHGNPWLLSTLVEMALAARRGSKRAVVAVAHTILTIVYHLLPNGTTYQDLGENYFDERSRLRTVRKAVQRLERLGYEVAIQPA